jgi:hypothetical protein
MRPDGVGMMRPGSAASSPRTASAVVRKGHARTATMR